MSTNLQNTETSSVEYPFDRMETATELSSIEIIEGTIAADEEKWYKFTTSSANAHVNGNLGEYDFFYAPGVAVVATLFDSNGTEIAYYDSVTVYDFRAELPYNETFYIRVAPAGDETGDFRVHSYVHNQQELLNNGFASATLMSVFSDSVTKQSSLQGMYERRWFKIHAAGMRGHLNGEANEYYVTVSCSAPTVTILYDSTGKEIARNYNGSTAEDSTLTCMLLSGGYYYASVYSKENTTAAFEITADYKIMPNLGSCIEAAIRLTNGQNYEESFSASNEDKWFKFTATAHDGAVGGYAFSGIFTRDFTATLFDSEGNVIQPIHSLVHSRDFSFHCTMATNATYYLRVTSMSEDGGDFYVQAIETPSILNTGSSMSDAITIYNIYTPVAASISTPGEAKWFKLTVDGDYDKIIVHSIGGTAVNGELYDALNELVCSDTQVDSKVNFRMDADVTPFYTYYLKVTGQGDSVGDFEVRWSNGFNAEAIDQLIGIPTLQVGDTVDLSSYVTPANDPDIRVTWSSTNPNVADVDKYGFVTTYDKGTASIRAVSGMIEAYFPLDVYIPTRSIYFPEDSYETCNGEELVLDIEITPEDASLLNVDWEIEGEDIIDFNPTTLTVTGKKPGRAVLSAINDGCTIGYCEIVVKEKVVVEKYLTKDKNDEGNNELRVYFTYSNKVWRIVNHDTIFYLDPNTMDPDDIPPEGIPVEKAAPDNIDEGRCWSNFYVGYDYMHPNLDEDLEVRTYTDEEIKVLYAIDPFGVADYVLKYSQYLAENNRENNTTDKRVVAAMLEKDRYFKVIFGQDAKHYTRDSQTGKWSYEPNPENLADCYSDSEAIFGMHMVWDEYLWGQLIKAAIIFAVDCALTFVGVPAFVNYLKLAETTAKNLKRVLMFAFTFGESLFNASTDFAVDYCLDGTSINWVSDIYSLGGYVLSFVDTINSSYNFYPQLFDYYIEELDYVIYMQTKEGIYSLKDIRELIEF